MVYLVKTVYSFEELCHFFVSCAIRYDLNMRDHIVYAQFKVSYHSSGTVTTSASLALEFNKSDINLL